MLREQRKEFGLDYNDDYENSGWEGSDDFENSGGEGSGSTEGVKFFIYKNDWDYPFNSMAPYNSGIVNSYNLARISRLKKYRNRSF